MTNEEKQLILSSYLGDSYWIRQKKALTIKFGGYVENYLQWKRSLITTLHCSKLWGSKNRTSILYEFTISKETCIWKFKDFKFKDLIVELGDMNELGFSILIYDNGYFNKNLFYYELFVGKYYTKKFATSLNDYLNILFNIHGTVRKQQGCKGYVLQYKVKDTPIIATLLKKYSNHDYCYKIPSSETIAFYASKYADILKDLSGPADNIVRSIGKLIEE